MSESLNGTINYEDLRKVIFDYFQKKGIEITGSIEELSRILSGSEDQPYVLYTQNKVANDRRPYHPGARFEISKEEIQMIFEEYLASKDCELLAVIFGENVEFKYKENPDIKDKKEEPIIELNMKENMGYEELRKILSDYFKNKGLNVRGSIGELQEILSGPDDQIYYLVTDKNFQVDSYQAARIGLSKKDIQTIFEEFVASKGCELSDITFGEEIEFNYKENPNLERKKEENIDLDLTYNGQMDYSSLRQIIFDYFKKSQGIELSSASTYYLEEKLRGGTDPRPFFIIKDEMFETRFDISAEDIQKIFAAHLASKGFELSSVEYGDVLDFKYKENPEIQHSKEENIDLDITYNGQMDYRALRQIIFDYYKEKKGIELHSISIDYLQRKLTDGSVTQPFFIVGKGKEERRFDIPPEEMKQILGEYLAKRNCELTDLSFDYKVEFKYKKRKQEEKKIEQEQTVGFRINKSGEIIRDSSIQAPINIPVVNAPHFEPPKEDTVQVAAKPDNSRRDELTSTADEKKRLTILQRERAMNDAQKAKNRAAIMAGVCILGACVALYFKSQPPSQVIQHELESLQSLRSLGQYLQDLGPLTTLLAISAGSFVGKYFKNSKKFNDAKKGLEEFNASQMNKAKETGGNDNERGRSR